MVSYVILKIHRCLKFISYPSNSIYDGDRDISLTLNDNRIK